MGFLKKIFKKKPGGTMFGNLLRGATKLVAASGLLPGSQLVANLLPDAPPALVDLGQTIVAEAATGPVLNPFEVKTFASMAKAQLLQAGATPLQADNVGAAVFTAASLPAPEAAIALRSAAFDVPANSFGRTEIKAILNGAANGARDGATSAYLNDTQMGKDQKTGAINAEGAKIMPWIIAALFALCAVLFVKKGN